MIIIEHKHSQKQGIKLNYNNFYLQNNKTFMELEDKLSF